MHSGSLLEASSGDLYALQDRALERHTGDRWVAYPLPPTITANVTFSKVLGEVAGGRLVFHAGDLSRAFGFDPSTGAFTEVRHPEGRTIEVLGRKRPLGVWTITRAPGQAARVESFDGTSFSVRATLDSSSGSTRASASDSRNERRRPARAAGSERRGPDPRIDGPLADQFRWASCGRSNHGGPKRRTDASGSARGKASWSSTEPASRPYAQACRPSAASSPVTTARSGPCRTAACTGSLQGSWLSLTDDDGLPDAAVIDLRRGSRGAGYGHPPRPGSRLVYPEADHDEPETSLVAGRNPSEAPPSGDVGLSFTAVDRWHQTRTDRLLFWHGVDSGLWSPYTGETTAALTGLQPGAHSFAVRAMDRDGNVDRTPAVWSFTVLLPVATASPVRWPWGALGIAGLAMASVLFVTRHRRLERLVQERTEAPRGDVTERQRAEAERARLEEQLRQAQKMEAVGRLAGGIAHDFNNLLTVDPRLQRAAARASSTPSDARRATTSRRSAAPAERAAALTRQLLAFSRKQVLAADGRSTSTRVVTDARADAAAAASARTSSSTVSTRPTLGAVKADPGQIEQVIMNLVVNARDAMPTGGKLTIETRERRPRRARTRASTSTRRRAATSC